MNRSIALSLIVVGIGFNVVAQEAAPTPPTTEALPEQPGNATSVLLPAGMNGTAVPGTIDPKIQSKFKSAVDLGSKTRMAFDKKAITLDEALRVTLFKQPSIRLSEQDAEVARAAMVTAMAPFDHTVYAKGTGQRTIDPTPDTRIQAQMEARRGLIRTLKGVKQAEASAKSGSTSGSGFTPQTGLSNLDPRLLSENDAQILDLLEQQAQALQTPNPMTNTPVQDPSVVAPITQQINDINKTQLKVLQNLDKQLTQGIRDFHITRTTFSDTWNYEAGLRKTYRNGISINPRVSWNKSGQNNAGAIDCSIDIPLGKGAGGVSLRAAEDSSRLDYEASKLRVRHEVSSALTKTAQAFWNCLAAQQNYAALKNSLELNQSYVQLTELRVTKGAMSEGEAAKSKARESQLLAQTIRGEFALLDARYQLATAMGLEAREIQEPPYAAGDLPTVRDFEPLDSEQRLISIALGMRDDWKAAMTELRSGKLLVDAAKYDLRPTVDLFTNFGYKSVDEGTTGWYTVSPFFDRQVGWSAKVSVNGELPLENHRAKADYFRSVASYKQRKWSAQDLENNLRREVLSADAELHSTLREMDASKQASGYFRKSLVAERARLDAGEGSLLDSIIVEQDYTNSLTEVIAVNLRHANALASLRFATGTVLVPGSGVERDRMLFASTDFYGVKTIPEYAGLSGTSLEQMESSLLAKQNLPLLKRLANTVIPGRTPDPVVPPSWNTSSHADKDMKVYPLVPDTDMQAMPTGGSKNVMPAAGAPASRMHSAPAPTSMHSGEPAAAAGSSDSGPAPVQTKGAPKPLLNRIFQ